MATRSSMRKDSSASTVDVVPGSPLPSSLEALPAAATGRKRRSNAQESIPAGASAEASTSKQGAKEAAESSKRQPGEEMGFNGSRRTGSARKRSGSLQEKGAAVLRALARAEEDGASETSHTSHDPVDDARAHEQAQEDDSGYDGEENSGHPNSMPTANGSARMPPHLQMQEVATPPPLTEEEKQLGRTTRENIRRKQEVREVERATKSRTAKRKNKRKTSSGVAKKPKSWEIPRKIFHSSIGFLVLYLYLSRSDLRKIVKGLSTFLGVVVTADVIRLNFSSFEWLYERVLGFLMRETEKEKVNGVVWYLIGVLFCLHFMPEDIACVSIMILSWADTSASVFGRLFGAYTPPLPSPPFATRKSLAGTIAAATASTLTAAMFWATPIAQSARRSLLATEGRHAIPLPVLCIGTGLVGGIAEALELGGIDDNLSLPILTALGIKGLTAAWRWLFG